ncbi:MAG TPA: hypothetical protein VF501_01295 [Thiobacillus sp.]
MTLDPKIALRLQFLMRVVRRECQHLAATDQRLFSDPFTTERVRQLEADAELAERVEAFVGRFGRLQDTVGDKLLPVLLTALGETPASTIDNLDRAERLGLIVPADEWMTLRKLRNQMVHEYVEDPTVLAGALQSGHGFVPVLVAAANSRMAEIERRGWSK